VGNGYASLAPVLCVRRTVVILKQISYSEAICARVFVLRNEPCEAIAAKIQKEFSLPIRPHRQTIAKILKRGGAALPPKHQKKEKASV
jgi:hypothetical protein